MNDTTKQAILDSLTKSLHETEGNDSGDVNTEEGDLIAGVRDYIESTATNPLDERAVAEVAYAWLAGAEHETGDHSSTRVAFRALRKAGLNL